MTERYEVHNMIRGYDIGEIMDLEVCKSLIEKYGSSEDIELFITDNGKGMTYGEVADQLNRYYKREEILKQVDNVNDLSLSALNLQEKLKESKEENEQLREIVKLSYYNEICEHCKYGHYFGSGGHLEYNEFDFECKKKHFGNDHWRCDNLKECEDFELNDLNKLLEVLE